MPSRRCEECGGDGNHRKGCKSSCPSGKCRIASEQEAQMILTEAKIRATLHGRRHRREKRIYYCWECFGFHLTSKP